MLSMLSSVKWLTNLMKQSSFKCEIITLWFSWNIDLKNIVYMHIWHICFHAYLVLEEKCLEMIPKQSCWPLWCKMRKKISHMLINPNILPRYQYGLKILIISGLSTGALWFLVVHLHSAISLYPSKHTKVSSFSHLERARFAEIEGPPPSICCSFL